MKHSISILLLSMYASISTYAQVRIPAMSPLATVEQRIGLTDIEVSYSRPIAKGRTVFGEEGVVVYDKIWRTGANAATYIKLSEDALLADQTLKAGKYAILTKPSLSQWQLYFYPYESGNWSSYSTKEPALTLLLKSQKTKEKAESLTININPLSLDSGELSIGWGYTKITIPIHASAREKVLTNIEKVMAGPGSNDYFLAALYLHEEGIELNKALAYIQKVTKGENPQFFQVYREALILADLGKKTEAIQVAQKSLELSKKAGNADFVRLNKNNIQKWSL